jgi:hypothetical protein
LPEVVRKLSRARSSRYVQHRALPAGGVNELHFLHDYTLGVDGPALLRLGGDDIAGRKELRP